MTQLPFCMHAQLDWIKDDRYQCHYCSIIFTLRDYNIMINTQVPKTKEADGST